MLYITARLYFLIAGYVSLVHFCLPCQLVSYAKHGKSIKLSLLNIQKQTDV